ncbi:hemerythrin domain-containing protein [Ferrovibrio sp.]|uniref:hemerythrin domain-containing protein n=1 Tax=Ferrovibrio sp. TaxID=1917215 RepID=UPI000CB7D1E2|nr:hemerythrin domain-containing protein [Ferrovibrio sp.]PJI39647.1 MAG: iron-sulfur cluster repair di-iron protein [Ferrovibrio sp.]
MSDTAASAAPASPQSVEPLPAESGALIDHILQRYHETHRRELEILIAAARRVEMVHANHPALPKGLTRLLQDMKIELEMHMCKEEHVLFPLMKEGQGTLTAQPISLMLIDHEDQIALIRLLDSITDNCTPPPEACSTWRNLYTGIRKLLNDLDEHISIENTVLFPRFMAPGR